MNHTGRPSVKATFEHINRAPVFTITLRTLPPSRRSVGFVLDSLPDGRHVLCTVGHAFFPENDPQAYRCGLLDSARELSIECHLTPINSAYDISFLVARPVEDFSPIIFERPRNERFTPKALYNAKNCVGEPRPPLLLALQTETRFHEEIVMAPPWRDYMNGNSTASKVLHPQRDAAQIKELEDKGWAKMSYMTLFSRPGFSGSPIWDDRWQLYGMGVRGTKSWQSTSGGDLLAYYPASAIDRMWSEVRAIHSI